MDHEKYAQNAKCHSENYQDKMLVELSTSFLYRSQGITDKYVQYDPPYGLLGVDSNPSTRYEEGSRTTEPR